MAPLIPWIAGGAVLSLLGFYFWERGRSKAGPAMPALPAAPGRAPAPPSYGPSPAPASYTVPSDGGMPASYQPSDGQPADGGTPSDGGEPAASSSSDQTNVTPGAPSDDGSSTDDGSSSDDTSTGASAIMRLIRPWLPVTRNPFAAHAGTGARWAPGGMAYHQHIRAAHAGEAAFSAHYLVKKGVSPNDVVTAALSQWTPSNVAAQVTPQKVMAALSPQSWATPQAMAPGLIQGLATAAVMAAVL